MFGSRQAEVNRPTHIPPTALPLLRVTASFLCAFASVSCALAATNTPAQPVNGILGEVHELNDNGAWSWFMDPRVIVDHGRLIVGSVRAAGRFEDSGLPGWGNVELSVLDLVSGQLGKTVLHPAFEQDDHDSPGLLVRPDGRYLAIYSKHNQETRFYYRVSTQPGDPFNWGPVLEFVTPGVRGSYSHDSVTYANPIRLASEDGRIYLLHRGFGQDPNYLISDDQGQSWRYGGHLFVGRHGYSPYAKYASNGRDTIHIVATEDHPRNWDNSLYHGFIRHGNVYGSGGDLLAPLPTGTNTPLQAWGMTRIYQGGPSNVAWMCDIRLDPEERPVVLFTVQRDGAGLPVGSGGMDHRFHYARWDGKEWLAYEIAYAGTRLYPGEDDYTGLGAIDPRDTRVVFISTDADPVTGKPLMSKGNFRRNHELFRGFTADGGKSWAWTAITTNSTTDNLRPIIPFWQDSRTALVWMRGFYVVNRGEWTTKVMATLLRPGDFEARSLP